MKATLEIELETGITIPITHEIDTLASIGGLGRKLAALPRGANKLVPGLTEAKVKKLRFAKE
jgi:hypothetical protein